MLALLSSTTRSPVGTRLAARTLGGGRLAAVGVRTRPNPRVGAGRARALERAARVYAERIADDREAWDADQLRAWARDAKARIDQLKQRR